MDPIQYTTDRIAGLRDSARSQLADAADDIAKTLRLLEKGEVPFVNLDTTARLINEADILLKVADELDLMKTIFGVGKE